MAPERRRPVSQGGLFAGLPGKFCTLALAAVFLALLSVHVADAQLTRRVSWAAGQGEARRAGGSIPVMPCSIDMAGSLETVS